MFIEKLAGMYDDLVGPPGIPWDGLIAKGHGIDDNGFDGAYQDLMLQEGAKFLGVLGKLSQEFRDKYRTIQAGDARHAMTQLMALINQTGADVWQATKAGDWEASVHFPRSLAVDALATLAASSMNGAYLHYDGVMENAMRAGKVTPDDVMAHANSLMQTWQTFVDLEKNGHLDQFKTTPAAPAAGVGALPVLAGWALAALGIVLVLGICYLVYVWQIGSPITDKVIAYCDKLSKTGTADDMRNCIAAMQSIQKGGNPDLLGFMGSLLQPLAWVAAIGLGLYVASLVVPMMLASRRRGAAA
jgi:hypothetical protein